MHGAERAKGYLLFLREQVTVYSPTMAQCIKGVSQDAL